METIIGVSKDDQTFFSKIKDYLLSDAPLYEKYSVMYYLRDRKDSQSLGLLAELLNPEHRS